MKRFYGYYSEGLDLILERLIEASRPVQTPREAASDAADLIKDKCDLPAGQWTGSHEVGPLGMCRRRGVPVVFSSLYDAQ